MAEGWNSEQVRLAVDYYFTMLNLELDGVAFVKADFERKLAGEIGRSKSAADYKFRNISAILTDAGALRVRGYAPMSNVQRLLRDRVMERLAGDVDLRRAMIRAVDEAPGEEDLPVLTNPADPPVVEWREDLPTTLRSVPGVDFLAREASNRALGLGGELAVLRRERTRLRSSGREALAARVRHVALEDGDGAGYDILSYEPDGTERFIEVKTTRQAATTPFFLSANELRVSQLRADQYRLVRVFGFGYPEVGFYELAGPLDHSAELRPDTYKGLPRETHSEISATSVR